MSEELKPTHSKMESSNIPPPIIEQSHETNSNVKGGVSLQHTKDKPCECDSKEGCSCNANTNSGNMDHYRSYVYAIGNVVHRFPNRSIEVELAQATGRSPEEQTRGRTGEEVIHAALTDPANRYIPRQICYVLNIEGLETYILVPADPLDIDRLAQALRPAAADVVHNDVIIGRRGPIAPPDMCGGLQVPIVIVDQIYSFDRDALIKAIPRRKGEEEGQFKKTANALFNHIIQIADNAGATDEHRAKNWLAVRSADVYHRTQLMQDENYSLSTVDVRTSRLSGTSKIVDVIFIYENRANRATQKWFARVDVTGEFPFLVSPMQEYFEH
jgi:hypothetical protein